MACDQCQKFGCFGKGTHFSFMETLPVIINI